MEDWTATQDGLSNSSPEFLRICDEVARLIRSGAHDLIAGHADNVARLIVVKLAHVHGMRPAEKYEHLPVPGLSEFDLDRIKDWHTDLLDGKEQAWGPTRVCSNVSRLLAEVVRLRLETREQDELRAENERLRGFRERMIAIADGIRR